MRSVDEIAWLADVSPVIDPAYVQTSVEARSWEAPEEKMEEPEKTEQREEGLTESAHIVHRILLGL
jgi:phage head maturation protease